MEKILKENENWRIIFESSGRAKSFLSDYHNRSGTRVRFNLGKAVARLEEKKSCFLFWTYWHQVEFTNLTSVVNEWIVKYFDKDKIRPGCRREVIEGVIYEITKDGQRYQVDKNGKRWNPAHTPELGSQCGCSGCDGCLGGP